MKKDEAEDKKIPELQQFPTICSSTQCLFCLGDTRLPHESRIFCFSRPRKARFQQRRSFCGVREDLDHQSDHLPIVTTIMTEVEAYDPPTRRQWQRTNEDVLGQVLGRVLPPLTPLSSEEDVDRRAHDIVAAISEAIEASTPIARPSTRSILGWTQGCKDAQMTARRLRRRYPLTRQEDDWEA